MQPVLARCKIILPPLVRAFHPLPYLAPALDAGMATLFAEELIEALRYLEFPDFYTKTEDPLENNIWLGAADDVILRKRGVEFVDGTAPGFAAILGAAPNAEIATQIARELQQKTFTFSWPTRGRKAFSRALIEAGVEIGWTTRLVSFGRVVSATVLPWALRPPAVLRQYQPGGLQQEPDL